MLGVRPDASHDEVKRAYATAALRWHPDRQTDPSPAAVRRAAHRMAEINAAWEVLRNPAARAAYDASLSTGPRPHRRDETTSAPSDAAVLVPDLARRLPPTNERRVPLGCLWAIGVAVAGVGAVVALIALGDASGPPVDVRTRERLGVGACAVVVGDGRSVTVAEVPCTEPHDAVVVGRVRFPLGCDPGRTAVLLDDQETVVCLEARP